jgi:tetraacyldisaccharide 4'-kinase
MSAPELLDARSRGVRLLERYWEGSEARDGAFPRGLARLTGALGRRLLRERIAGRGEPPGSCLVLSVGNLRLGGTGKTPVVIALAEELGRRGRRGAVITRGYGGRRRGPILVSPDTPGGGDEARLMAARLPAWAVVQARNRRAGLDFALRLRPAPEIVLLEDGHQSAGAARHLDLLILDRWQLEGDLVRPRTGLTLPWGPYREDARGAQRAALWILETTVDDPGRLVGESEQGRVPVLTFQRHLSLPEGVEKLLEGPYGVCSGIARPEPFEAACAELVGRPPAWVARFDDHAAYEGAHLRRLRALAAAHGGFACLTTEKDWIKLEPLWLDMPLAGFPVRLEIEWGTRAALLDWIEERLRDFAS